jgi:hypothetical protein
MKTQSVWMPAALAAVLVLGCENQKAPAEQAVASAETALAAVRDSAQKYVPDQLQAAETQLGTVKDDLAKGDYKGVLAAAPGLNASIASLKDAAEAKKADAEAALAKAKADWGPIGTEVPKLVAELDKRVAALSKSRRLPKGVTREAVDSAKSELESVHATWDEASSASASGDYTTAVGKAQAVKDKAEEIMKSLHLTAAA